MRIRTRIVPAGLGVGLLLAVLLSVAGCTTPRDATERSPSDEPGSLEIPVDPARREALARIVFVRGMTLAQLNEHREAIQYYQEALHIRPAEPAVLSALADSYAALSDIRQAVTFAERALALAPDNASYRHQLAELHLRAGDTDLATNTYHTLLASSPENTDALRELARIQTSAGQYFEAIRTYEQLMTRTGRRPDVLAEVLDLYRRVNDDLGMERTLRSMLLLQPAATEIHRSLTEVYLRQDRLVEAARIMEQAMETGTEPYENATSLAEVYRRLGRIQEADSLLATTAGEERSAGQIVDRAASFLDHARTDPVAGRTAGELLDQALALEPNNVAALRLRAELALAEGETLAAAQYYHRAADADPRQFVFWHRASVGYLQAGRYHEADSLAAEALLLYPRRAALIEVSGYARMHAQKNKEAIARFRQLLTLLDDEAQPDVRHQADVLSTLGTLYDRTKAYAASDSAFRAALELTPDDAGTLNNYAATLARRGENLSDALRYALKAARLEPESAPILDTVGWVHFRRREYDRARQWLERAVATGNASASVYEHLGDTLDALGERSLARKSWRRALALQPDLTRLNEKLR